MDDDSGARAGLTISADFSPTNTRQGTTADTAGLMLTGPAGNASADYGWKYFEAGYTNPAQYEGYSNSRNQPTSTESSPVRPLKQAFNGHAVLNFDQDPTNSQSYTIKVFKPSQITGGSNAIVDGRYALTGDPAKVFKVTRLPSSSTLKFEQITAAGAQPLSEISSSSVSGTRTVIRNGTLKQVQQFSSSTVSGQLISSKREKQIILVNTQDVVLSDRKISTRIIANKEQIVQEISDPDGAALTTTYYYYENTPGDGDNYGHVARIVTPSGNWTYFGNYDSDGVARKIVRQFGSNAMDLSGTGESQNWLDTSTKTWSGNIWTTTTTTALMGATVVQSVLEEDVTVRYTTTSSATGVRPYVKIRETRLGGTGTTSDAVTETWRDPVQGHVLREQRPDGTVSIYGYENLVTSTTSPDNGKVIYIGTGVSESGNPMELASGTAQTITYSTTQTGSQVLTRIKTVTTTAIPSDLILAKTVETSDALGHVQSRETHGPNGVVSTESYTYNEFDQVLTQTNRDGTTTEFEYDDQRRVVAQITSQGSTVLSHTTTHYDSLGRVIATGRMLPASGGGSAEQPLSATGYDALGRTLTRSDALGRTTTFAYTVSDGRPVTTTTYPGGGTVVETSEQDGSPAKTTGTAASPSRRESGVEALVGVQRRYEKTIALDAVGNDTGEWVKTYFDGQGRPIRTVYPDGAYNLTEYDAAGRPIKSADPDGVTTLMAYDVATDTETSALDYNQNGAIDYGGTDRISQTVRSVVPWGSGGTWGLRRTTTKIWDTLNADTPRTVAHSDSSADGSYRRHTDENDDETVSVMAYLGGGVTAATVTTPDNAVVTSTSSGGRLLAQTRRLGGAGGAVVSSVANTYDAAGRLTDVAESASGQTVHTTRTYYDDDQIETLTRPDPDSAGAIYAAQTTTFEYDEAGRLWKTHLPDGLTVETRTYYPSGALKKISGGLGYPQEYTYDAQGRQQTLKTWKDAANDTGAAVTTWSYSSARGWLTHKLYEGGTNSLSYTYTAAGRQHTRVGGRGLTTTYSYTAAGEPAQTTYSDGTPTVYQTYDRLGRPLVTSDAAGNLTRTYTGSHLVTEGYAADTAHGATRNLLPGQTLTRSYDAANFGRATGLSTSGGYAVGYGYDANHRLVSVSSGSLSAAYGYFSTYGANPIESVTFKEGVTATGSGGVIRLTTTKAYDDAGRLTSIAHTASTSSTSAATVRARGYLYTPLDQRAYAVDGDGKYWAYTYDGHGQVVTAQKRVLAGSAPGGSDTTLPGYGFGFAFDDIGNRKTATTNGRTATYTSNLLNQYTQRTVPGAVDVRGTAPAGAAVIVTSAVTQPPTNLATERTGPNFYTALLLNNAAAPVAGSLAVVMAGPGTTASGSVPIAREWRSFLLPPTPQPYTHDADGNLLTDGVWNRTYDAENRLIAQETHSSAYAAGAKRERLTFAYDAGGRRVAKQVYAWVNGAWSLTSDTRFLYDGWNMIAELDALNGMAMVKKHVWGLDLSNTAQGAGGVGGLLFSTVTSGTDAGTYAACPDGNGNTIAWINAVTGAIAGEADYQPFGETVVLMGVAKTMNYGFSTKYLDRETGLLYYGYRYYDPSTGRWLNRDPLGEAGGPNLYGFNLNDPVNYYDPDGLEPRFVTTAKQWVQNKVTGAEQWARDTAQGVYDWASGAKQSEPDPWQLLYNYGHGGTPQMWGGTQAPGSFTYTQDSAMVQSLIASDAFQKGVLPQVRLRIQSGKDHDNFSASLIDSPWYQPLKDFTGVATRGYVWQDFNVSFVGSWGGTWQVTCLAADKAIVAFHGRNATSASSNTRTPWPKSWRYGNYPSLQTQVESAWNNFNWRHPINTFPSVGPFSSGLHDNPAGTAGPLTNVEQRFEFTLPITLEKK